MPISLSLAFCGCLEEYFKQSKCLLDDRCVYEGREIFPSISLPSFRTRRFKERKEREKNFSVSVHQYHEH